MVSVTQEDLPHLACQVYAVLLESSETTVLPEWPARSAKHCEKAIRLLRLAELRGWGQAAARVRREAASQFRMLGEELMQLAQQMEPRRSGVTLASAADVYRDLLGLRQEFGELRYEREANLLILQTEHIELDEIELGRFEIRLDLRQRHAESPYRIVALDPNAAASRPELVHPHVLDEILCAGDGRQAIKAALAAGRLFDFFQLVTAVLTTYNPESPYLELGDWFSQACHDCGLLTHEESGSCCPVCDAWLCSECESICEVCGEYSCLRCLATCGSCEQPCCAACLGSCQGCQQSFCHSCLTEEERCTLCYEEANQTSDEPAAVAPAPVHPLRVGQTPLPARSG